MERNKPLRLASARALAARAACRRASLSVVRPGNGVGFRCVTGGSVGEFDIVRARFEPMLQPWAARFERSFWPFSIARSAHGYSRSGCALGMPLARGYA